MSKRSDETRNKEKEKGRKKRQKLKTKRTAVPLPLMLTAFKISNRRSNTNVDVWERLVAYSQAHPEDEAVSETVKLVAVVRAAEDISGVTRGDR